MAETASGWLKPGDLSKRGSSHRALQLLAQYLDEDQQEQVERYGGFAEVTHNRVFWISLCDTPWCADASDGRVEHLCIAPDERKGMPEGDVTLTYLLWIRFDVDGFMREANVLSTKKIEWPDSEAELVEALAGCARPAPPTPKKRRKVMRPTRSAGLCLDPERVETIFRSHGKDIPDGLLRKLTAG